MRITTKRSIIAAGLAVFAAWPPVHYAITATTELSPWKGFGWAMYCVPARQVTVRVNPLDGEAPAIPEPARQPRGLLRAYVDFVERRRAVGRWARPDAFARAVLEEYPDAAGIEIVVEQAAVDRATATFVLERRDRYEYRRPAG